MTEPYNVMRQPGADDLANAKRAIERLDMPPASVRYQQGRTTSTIKRLGDMVRERGIESGTIGLRIARRIDRRAYHGQVLEIAGAKLTVEDPAQA